MSDVPFEIQRIDHLVLRTRNADRLVVFYRGLGCEVVREVESMGMVQLSAGRSMIDIVAAEDAATAADGQGRNLDHFALRIEPFDEAAILEFCAEREIPVTVMSMPLLGADGYGPAVYLEDPDGNRLELKGPPVVSDP